MKLKTAHEVNAASPTRRSNLPTIPPSKQGNMFGMPSGYRTAEVVRSFGPEEPPVKYLVQGAYQVRRWQRGGGSIAVVRRWSGGWRWGLREPDSKSAVLRY